MRSNCRCPTIAPSSRPYLAPTNGRAQFSRVASAAISRPVLPQPTFKLPYLIVGAISTFRHFGTQLLENRQWRASPAVQRNHGPRPRYRLARAWRARGGRSSDENYDRRALPCRSRRRAVTRHDGQNRRRFPDVRLPRWRRRSDLLAMTAKTTAATRPPRKVMGSIGCTPPLNATGAASETTWRNTFHCRH